MATSISDLPFVKDKSDFKTDSYVMGLVGFIRNAQTPLTIALQGEWGSGKTSLMLRLESELCQGVNSEFIGISINTWEYSMLATPEETVYKILGKLVKDISRNDYGAKKTLKRFLRGTGNFLYRGGRELVKAVPVAGHAIGAVVEALDVPAQNPFFSENEDDVSLSEVRASLVKAVQQRIASENISDDKNEVQKKGIIIFIDDLDRLNPPVAVEILELLKNVFTLENCIFVLAIDYEVVVKGLEPKFGKLTNRNEREFRSFFDKIIQVPFSLPVNSYQPMDFVMESLREIGYLPKGMDLDDGQKKLFSDVVEASVGNNPRSIKRLINTLSLLDCITKATRVYNIYSYDDSPLTKNEVREKLLNFIIVAIQICYPRIYTLLVHKPNFTEWDLEFASREGIDSNELADDNAPDWSDFLEAACSSDIYLTQRYLDISKLFSMMMDIIAANGGNAKENIGIMLKEILDKTSVTGVRSNVKVEEFDKKTLIYKLHENVGRRINQLRPDIVNIRFKNNTGNGGIKFRVDDGHSYDIRFVPDKMKNTIMLRLDLSTRIARPENMVGMSFDKLLENQNLAEALSAFDERISPLLQQRSFFTSIHSKGENFFTSYSDELRYNHRAGFMSDDVTHDAVYLITLPKPSDFETEMIIDAIADVVIANYNFRNSMKDWS